MRTFKIALVIAAVALMAAACKDPNYVPRTEYNALLEEYAELQTSADATRAEYAAQAAAVDNILQQLAQISGKTVTLRTDLEHGTAQLTQVEQIEGSISEIKTKLAQLDKLTAQSKELQKMVSSLKKVITEKEKEIENLKAEIRAKDATIQEQHLTISEQHGTIRSQNETIEIQQENLRAAVQEQAQMLFQAGVDFEALGDDVPSVSRRKDKKSLQEFRAEMYRKAILYYSQAREVGYPEATYRISAVQEKIAQL